MTTASRGREEELLKKLLPWLSQEFGENLQWLGRPEDPKYHSACEAARNVRNPLDAELQGPTLRLAVEHTSIDSFPIQRRMQAAFNQLAGEIRKTSHQVPPGNNLNVSVDYRKLPKTA